jgi:hypothetical protein
MPAKRTSEEGTLLTDLIEGQKQELMKDLMTDHSYIKIDPPLLPNEPYHVLRGSDLLAAHLTEKWAYNAEAHGTDPRKVAQVREIALKMLAFPDRTYP